MFTGLVQCLATVCEIQPAEPGCRLVIEAPEIAPQAKLGDSIAINGCCLTVVEQQGHRLSFDAGPETLARTNLGKLTPGGRVNVEASLRVGDALGGHFVTGHVEAVGTLDARTDDRDWSTLWFRFPPELGRYMVPKGSVAVDGVSLTLVEVEPRPIQRGPDSAHAGRDHARRAGRRRAREPGNRSVGQIRPKAIAVVDTPRQVARGRSSLLRHQPFMPAPASHQTISYLGRRFAASGIRLNTRHGQNFLVDLNLLRMIAQRARLEPCDVVLEVGTGTGSLTALLAAEAAAVVTVEIDEQLYQLASEELTGLTNVVMLRTDALRNKSHLNAEVIAAVRQQLDAAAGRRLKLVANLPYNVATPVMANLLASSIVPDSMTVTVQKEVADRIAARPGTKDYSALSVWMQCQCQVELVRTLPPSVFWPRPKVTSAIIHIDVDEARRREIPNLAFFHDFARSLFIHRRKFLRSVLVSTLKGQCDKAAVDAILDSAQLNAELRAEQLDVPTILRLAEVVRERTGGRLGA